jgi:hypothetical protein
MLNVGEDIAQIWQDAHRQTIDDGTRECAEAPMMLCS